MSSSEGATGAVVVYVTVPTQEVAEKIAALLVNPDHRLAACVNIVPGISVEGASELTISHVAEVK